MNDRWQVIEFQKDKPTWKVLAEGTHAACLSAYRLLSGYDRALALHFPDTCVTVVDWS